jgi:hypothetical protein
MVGSITASDGEAIKDFSRVSLDELEIKPVPERKDPVTGFVVAGKNDTPVLQKLTEINGRSIRDLESEMRPGQSSTKGFLGKDEKLLDGLMADNKYVVEEQKRTHQELARHLKVLAAIGGKQPGVEFLYHGQRFQVTLRSYRGYQDSPFHDDTKSNSDATVKNVTNGKTLEYSLLVPEMIERYGFYEGHGTPYRVDPKQILVVLNF